MSQSPTQSDPLESDPAESTITNAPRQLEPTQELRLIVYALAACVFLMSVAANVFMYKQNGRVGMEIENANRQIAQIEQNQGLLQNKAAMENLLKEIAAELPRHPEVQQILAGYGLSVQQAPQGSAPAGMPAPPPAK
jgi:type VI protein secretion system component VasK